jgi:1-acyl-sn-glycerol-3-phosphate acyltransferase
MLYAFARFLTALVFHTAFRVRVTGRDRIPPAGGLLIISNHLSFADPILIGWLAGRHVEFMALVELFRHPFWGPIVRRLGAFPVDRSRQDHGAVREAVRRLRQGRCVAIFPEGGIRLGEQSVLNGRRSLKGGAALIAQMAAVPVLPVIVRDTRQFHDWRRWFRGGVMHITFGYPFSLLTRDRATAHAVVQEQLAKTVELD